MSLSYSPWIAGTPPPRPQHRRHSARHQLRIHLLKWAIPPKPGGTSTGYAWSSASSGGNTRAASSSDSALSDDGRGRFLPIEVRRPRSAAPVGLLHGGGHDLETANTAAVTLSILVTAPLSRLWSPRILDSGGRSPAQPAVAANTGSLGELRAHRRPPRFRPGVKTQHRSSITVSHRRVIGGRHRRPLAQTLDELPAWLAATTRCAPAGARPRASV